MRLLLFIVDQLYGVCELEVHATLDVLPQLGEYLLLDCGPQFGYLFLIWLNELVDASHLFLCIACIFILLQLIRSITKVQFIILHRSLQLFTLGLEGLTKIPLRVGQHMVCFRGVHIN